MTSHLESLCFVSSRNTELNKKLVPPYPPNVSREKRQRKSKYCTALVFKDSSFSSSSRCASIQTWTLTPGCCQLASRGSCVFTVLVAWMVPLCTNSFTRPKHSLAPCSALRKKTHPLPLSTSAWPRQCKCPRCSQISHVNTSIGFMVCYISSKVQFVVFTLL